jgi:RNA polymerase sigma-70 factor, ECF subfamily
VAHAGAWSQGKFRVTLRRFAHCILRSVNDDEIAMSEPAPAGDASVPRLGTDRDAFAALYDRYYPRIVSYCLRRLIDRASAEDVASEVFLKVAAEIRTFSGRTESDFRRWLFRVATNAVNAYLRQTLRRRELLAQAALGGAWKRDDTAHARTADRLDWPAVRDALAELGEREETIVTLRYFADLSYEEIGDIVELAPGAVRTALCRAIAELRKRFNTTTKELLDDRSPH